MRKKLVFSAGLFIAIAWYAHSINLFVGVEGGYTNNQLNTSTGYRAFTRYNNKSGFMAGIPVLVTFNEQFAVGCGLRYIQKNYRYERDLLDGFPMYSDYTNGFLQFPLFGDFSVGAYNWRIFFNLGGTLGIWLHSNRKGQLVGMRTNPYDPDDLPVHQFNERVQFNSTRDNRFEATLFAGFGFRYTIGLFTPFITAQYHYGLTDLQKNYMIGQVPRYNNTITVQTGVMFGGFSKIFGRSR